MPFVDHEMPADLDLQPIATKKRVNGKLFGPDNPPPGGVKGRSPKITRELKEGIIDGAADHGYDGEGLGGLAGYLRYCAERCPKAYLQLLGRLLPLQVNGSGSAGHHISTVNIVAIPSGEFLTSEAIEKARSHSFDPQSLIERTSQLEPAPAPVEPEFVPRSPIEARMLEELSALSREELLQRAKQAGLVDADEI